MVVQSIVEVFKIQTTDQRGEPSVLVVLFLVLLVVLAVVLAAAGPVVSFSVFQLSVFTNFAKKSFRVVEGSSCQFLFDFVFVLFLALFAAKRATTRVAAGTATVVPHAVLEGFELVHQLKPVVPQVQDDQHDGGDKKEGNGAAVNGLAGVPEHQ